ncbi:MAG: lysophospholipase L1-like esterase [Granulosicoccus sp.]|jgi:lysophospholipase L1-like esterase
MKKNKNSTIILSIILLLLSGLLCPPVRALIGYDMGNVTEALRVYYFFGSVFFFLLALLSVSGLPIWLSKLLKVTVYVLIIIGSVEFASAVAYRVLFGNWSHHQYVNLNKYMFQSHPYLVGTLIEGANHERDSLLYAHNSLGYRGTEFAKTKPEGKIRIATVGGSTTYGVGVNVEDTWPYQLSEVLGSGYEVINMGVPGYSSVENLIQTALHLSDYEPDLAVYFIGLNDLPNINVKDLRPDYSDYHAPALYGALGLCSNENVPSLATIKMALILSQRFGLLEGCPNQDIKAQPNQHAGVDERALSLYQRNLYNIASICKRQGTRVLFVPQILLEEVLESGNFNWWIPYVPTAEMDNMMHEYNLALKEVADSSGSEFSSAVLSHPWKKTDFVDMSHFNGASNQRMAELLATQILRCFETDSLNKQP